jgi:acetyl-CoA carboxylase biotin carboxyl carrier protein
VQPTELPPRSARTASTGADADAGSLHDDVVALARALPGNLSRLTVRDGDRAVEVEWAAGAADAGSRPAPAAAPEQPTGPAGLPEGTTPVKAPLVGTFYAAATPGAEPFVTPGTEVEAGQTLGIVEAMKLMNPILADEAGVVAEVLVGNAESVEYDQVLMLLRPAGSP